MFRLTPSHVITSKYKTDYKEIEQNLEKQLYQLTNPDEIMKAKEQAKQRQNLLICKNAFCYTLQNSPARLADNLQIIENIGNVLLNCDNETQRVILQFAAKSKSKEWLKFILKKSFSEYHLYSIHNKLSSQNLNSITSVFGCSSGRMVLFSHIIYVYFTCGSDDLQSLYDYKKNIDSFSNLTSERKSIILPLVEEIIEKAGRKSKSPTLATEVNVKSKDIEIISN